MVFCFDSCSFLISRRDTSDFTPGQIIDVSSPEAFASALTETRHYFLGRNALRTIAASSSSSILSMTLSLGSDKDHLVRIKGFFDIQNKYRFDIWDHPCSNKQEPITCALIVPVGNEQSLTFTTAVSIHQLLESVSSDRMIIITRMNGNRNHNLSDEEVKKDCYSILSCMVPLHGRSSITIYSPPSEGSNQYV